MKHLPSVSQLPPATAPSSFLLPPFLSFLSHHLSRNFSLKHQGCFFFFFLHISRKLTESFITLFHLWLSLRPSAALFISLLPSFCCWFHRSFLLSILLLFHLSGFIPPSPRLCHFLSYFVTESLLLHPAVVLFFCLSSSLFGLFLPRFQLTELFFHFESCCTYKYSLTSGLNIIFTSSHCFVELSPSNNAPTTWMCLGFLAAAQLWEHDCSWHFWWLDNAVNCKSSGAEVSNQHVRCQVTQQRFYEPSETINILSAI